VGDSFTVSAGVPFAHIYSERLERRLQALGPAGNRLRVMNLAVGGYDIVRYAVMLTEVGLTLDPDAVIVGIFPYNDFAAGQRAQDERIAKGLQPPPTRDRFETWRLYQLWRVTGWSLKSMLTYRLGTEPEPKAWEENVRALETIAALARRKGVPVAAILLPNVMSSFSGQRGAHERVRAVCGRIGMTCVEALDDFLASGIPARRFRLNLLDGHPNARYHEIVAARLAAALAGWAAEGP
jgi:lysophospholipase L1-like esterase